MFEVTARIQGQESTGTANANCYIDIYVLIYNNSGFELFIHLKESQRTNHI